MDPPTDTSQAPSRPAGTIELLISNLLRIGVVTSLMIIIAGTVLSFARHPDYLSAHQALEQLQAPAGAYPRAIPQVIDGVRHGRGQSIVAVGLLLLIATPVLRVACSVVAFAFEKDRTYVLITAIVLGLLLMSFFIGNPE